jgi:hypothetical protein
VLQKFSSGVGSPQLGGGAGGVAAGDAMQLAHHVQHVLTDQPGSERQVGGSSATQPVRQRILGNLVVELDGHLCIPCRVLWHPLARAAALYHLGSPQAQQLREVGSATLDHSRLAGQRLAAIGRAPGILVANRFYQFFLAMVAHGYGLSLVLRDGAGVLRTVQQRAEVAGNSRC